MIIIKGCYEFKLQSSFLQLLNAMFLKRFLYCIFFGALLNYVNAQDTTRIPLNSSRLTYADSLNKQSLILSEPAIEQPKQFDFITKVPDDLWKLIKSPFHKKSIPALIALAGSTALMIHYDQSITDHTKRFSVRNNIDTNTSYKILFRAGAFRMRIPTNLTSGLYNMGEGWVGLAIGGGIWLSGRINNNDRAKQTAKDLLEGFISTAVSSQFLKRTTGRESPFAATRPGGKWTPFPSIKEYQKNTPGFDAFPSGHLTTMMAYTTIIADNYPEKKWIRPLGYALISLTGYAMINTEVHWISDYPLALAIGYVQGKIITARHLKHKKKKIIGL